MSIKVMTWVWEFSLTGGTERLTLLAIADNAADDGSNAWPSLATLARKTRLDERSVRRILRRLEEGGHIKVELNAGPSGTNRYTVLMHRGEDSLPPGQNDPRTPESSPPGHSGPPSPDTRVPRTVLERPSTSSARVRAWRGTRISAAPDPVRAGAAGPATGTQCRKHRGSPANNCGPCRSEALGR